MSVSVWVECVYRTWYKPGPDMMHSTLLSCGHWRMFGFCQWKLPKCSDSRYKFISLDGPELTWHLSSIRDTATLSPYCPANPHMQLPSQWPWQSPSELCHHIYISAREEGVGQGRERTFFSLPITTRKSHTSPPLIFHRSEPTRTATPSFRRSWEMYF